MASKALILESDWLVFIDGVQVPHQGIRMQSSRNNLSSCTITLEPDALLTKLRPQSIVSVWARERFPDQAGRNDKVLADAQEQYYLYWEGLLAGHMHMKSPTSRSFEIQCESIFMPWARTKAFMFGVGAYHKSTVLSGSRQVLPGGDGPEGSTVFSFAALASRVDQVKDTPFVSRIQEAVAFLSAANGVLRQQTDRLSLLDRMSGMTDTVYQDLLGGLALNVIGDGMAPMPETASVLEVINHLQQYGFYSHYEIFAPVEGADSYPRRYDGPLGLDDRFKFTPKYQMNQLLFLPELYFVPPPPCNFIFPDHIRSMSVGRNFYMEPTRALVPDPLQANNGLLYHLAPASILRGSTQGELENMTSAEVFAQATGALRGDDAGDATSPYQQDVNGEVISLFQTILDSEIEKGIVPKVDAYRFETAAAFGTVQAAREGKSKVDPNAYSQLISSVVNYRLRLDQYTRQVSVDLMGHRDIVPGFSCVIFDQDISYFGFVESVSVTVDPLGTESTAVTLSKVRPVSKPDLGLLDKFVEAVDVLDSIRRTQLRQLGASALGAAAQRVSLTGTGPTLTAVLTDNDPYILGLYEQSVAKIQSEYDLEVDALLEELSQNTDIPVPPGFLNRELLTSEGLDNTYELLLGCSRFYSSDYAFEVKDFPFTGDLLDREFTAIIDATKEEFRNTQLEGVRMQAESAYALDNVYRMETSDARTRTQDSWQDVRDRNDNLGQTTFEWCTRNFTKRSRYRLGSYCQNNGLDLVAQTSDDPNPTPYLVMVPASSNFQGWDDTLFSKLVMPGSGTDPVIEDLRKSAPDYFRTPFRQDIITAYSKRHFGARAFDGS